MIARRTRCIFFVTYVEAWAATDTLQAFGPDVAARSQVYLWPLEKRPKSVTGHHGSLHAKCAIADTRWLLLSSANLTEYALIVLIKGGELPGRAEAYWTSLVEAGTLKSVRV